MNGIAEATEVQKFIERLFEEIAYAEKRPGGAEAIRFSDLREVVLRASQPKDTRYRKAVLVRRRENIDPELTELQNIEAKLQDENLSETEKAPLLVRQSTLSWKLGQQKAANSRTVRFGGPGVDFEHRWAMTAEEEKELRAEGWKDQK